MTWEQLGLWVFVVSESVLGVHIAFLLLLILWSLLRGGKRGK